MTKALVMFSGGLDSLLAIKILEQQGIDCTALCFTTPFFGKEKAENQAKKFGIKLITRDISNVHFDMLKNPKYGYGKNMNPCIDCHGFMFYTAGNIADGLGFDVIASGEVLGQRPMSQNKQALGIVNKLAQRDVLRPMSAKLLTETIYEQEGLVDREQLLDISGRSRSRQLDMAAKFGLEDFESPGGGCLLTVSGYSDKLRILINLEPNKILSLDAELIKHGRLDIYNENNIKFFAITGRDQESNKKLIEIIENKNNGGSNQMVKNSVNSKNTYYIVDLDGISGPTIILRIINNQKINQEIETQLKKIFKSKLKKIAGMQDSELKLKIKTVI